MNVSRTISHLLHLLLLGNVNNHSHLRFRVLAKLPEGVQLRVGTAASVLVMTGTSGRKSEKSAVAAPRALQ